MTFTHPLWLFGAAIAVVAAAWFYRLFERRRDVQALAYSNLAFVSGATSPSKIPGIAMLALWLVGIATLAAALAGPHFVARVPAKDATVMLCIDTSGSMTAQDIAPTRWQAALDAARGFIDAVPQGTRIGIVSFSSGADVIAAPTDDLDAPLGIGTRPSGATAIEIGRASCRERV